MNAGFAACGMICSVCYRHLAKTSCPGCLYTGSGKPDHCRTCRIAACVREHEYIFCFSCSEFPCGLIKSLDKSYVKRYGVSLIAFSLRAKDIGVENFLAEEVLKRTCDCGGIFSLHDRVCERCGRQFPQDP